MKDCRDQVDLWTFLPALIRMEKQSTAPCLRHGSRRMKEEKNHTEPASVHSLRSFFGCAVV